MVFSQILGQPKATRLLTRALAGDRLAHAYLLTGPDGVGKATAARSMAAVLFCLEPAASSPCGHCRGCIKFSSANHPDFIHVRPAGAGIKIDQVRELKKTLGFPPLESSLRITLVEDVHTMRREAANSLLKMLEEPPPDNLLLLTADDSEPLLPTITSRCQVIPFYPMPLEIVSTVLIRLDSTLTQEKAETLAALAGGCPGRTRLLDSEELLLFHQEIMDCLLGVISSEADQAEAALYLASKAAELKDGLETLFDLLRLLCKETMIVLLNSADTALNQHYLGPYVLRARERWNLEQLSDKMQAIDFAELALARNCNRQTVCEVLFLQLLAGPGLSR